MFKVSNKNNLSDLQNLQNYLNVGVLKNFVKFTRKHPYQSLFFNKVAGLRPAALLKKSLRYSCFPVNFTKNLFYRTPPVAASVDK